FTRGRIAGARGAARVGSTLAGFLSGLFAVHLAAGYVSNLEMAVPFLGAALLLTENGRRRTAGAAVLLAGSALAHPVFGATGAVILAGAALWAWRVGDRDETTRIAVAVGAAGVVSFAGMASMLIGPARLVVDTSRDGFLRRAGFSSTLVHEYRSRFVHRWTRYVQWLSVPLAVPGTGRLTGFRRRFLLTWSAVTLGGAAIGFATGLFPPDRMVTFGFAIPALAGLGVVAAWEWVAGRIRWLAWVLAALAVGAMAAGALMAYGRQPTFISPEEVAQVTAASRLADSTPPGTMLVFIVDSPAGTASFLATRAANVIRAALPPDRAADAYVYVGTAQNFTNDEPTVRGNPEYDALSRQYLADIHARAGGPAVGFILTAFDGGGAANLPPSFSARGEDVFVAAAPGDGVASTVTAAPPARDPLIPSSPGGIILATLAVVALLALIGGGWAAWAVRNPLDGWLIAPAFGIAVVVLFGVLLERLGLPLAGWIGPTVVSGAAGGGGYVLAAASRAKSDPRSDAAEPIKG
ncbi:MAG: hypothetical protein QOI81_136, partial [Actinomycetota bacterium]|nr:hypothetical protein [Actinomycetota bacterium]